MRLSCRKEGVERQYDVVAVRGVSVGDGDDADVPVRAPRHVSALLRAHHPDGDQRTQPAAALRRLPSSHPHAQRAASTHRRRPTRLPTGIFTARRYAGAVQSVIASTHGTVAMATCLSMYLCHELLAACTLLQ